MDNIQRENLNNKMEEIVKKYKNNNLLHSRLVAIYQKFSRCDHTISQTYHTELANLTSLIDFGCKFKDGKCIGSGVEMCCCSGCRGSTGFFRTTFFYDYSRKDRIEDEMLYYAKKFNLKTGFWRKDKGCILPRRKRSATCLTYNCSDRLTDEEGLLLNIIRHYEHYPSYLPAIIKMLKDYFLYRK